MDEEDPDLNFEEFHFHSEQNLYQNGQITATHVHLHPFYLLLLRLFFFLKWLTGHPSVFLALLPHWVEFANRDIFYHYILFQ